MSEASSSSSLPPRTASIRDWRSESRTAFLRSAMSPGPKSGAAVAVLGFAYQELEREGVGVVTAGVFLGAFPFGGGKWGDPHDYDITAFEGDFSF